MCNKTNRTSGVEGQVYVNGVDRVLQTFRKQSVYISQQDFLLTNLTVDEYMTSAAHLKLGNDCSENEKLSKVRSIHCAYLHSTLSWRDII
jgi:ABC-type multidrug transport system ATPase subunit